jgi:hypothetical protein
MDSELKDLEVQIAQVKQRLIDLPDDLTTESAELRERLLELLKRKNEILKTQIFNNNK